MDPGDDSRNGSLDVLRGFFELWVISDRTPLVKEGDVNKVPWALKATAVVFDVVSKAGRLNEWVLILIGCLGGINVEHLS